MRPSRTVAGVAVAALALGALPGLVGSFEPRQDRPVDAAAFKQVDLASARDRQADRDPASAAAGPSEGALGAGTPLREPLLPRSSLATPAQPNPSPVRPF